MARARVCVWIAVALSACVKSTDFELPAAPAGAKTLLLIFGTDENAELIARDVEATQLGLDLALADDDVVVHAAYYGCSRAELGLVVDPSLRQALDETALPLRSTAAVLTGAYRDGALVLEPSNDDLTTLLPDVRYLGLETRCRDFHEPIVWERSDLDPARIAWLDPAEGSVLLALQGQGAWRIERSLDAAPVAELDAIQIHAAAAEQWGGRSWALTSSVGADALRLIALNAEAQVVSSTLALDANRNGPLLIVGRSERFEVYRSSDYGDVSVLDDDGWRRLYVPTSTLVDRYVTLEWMAPGEVLGAGFCENPQLAPPTSHHYCGQTLDHIANGVVSDEVFSSLANVPTAIVRTGALDAEPKMYAGDLSGRYWERVRAEVWRRFEAVTFAPPRRILRLRPFGEDELVSVAEVTDVGSLMTIDILGGADRDQCTGFSLQLSESGTLVHDRWVVVAGNRRLVDLPTTAVVLWAERAEPPGCHLVWP